MSKTIEVEDMSRIFKELGRKLRDQAAQGIVEYALILAFVVGVAAAIFANGGLADAIGEAFFNVSTTISNAIDGSNEVKQKRLQKTLDDALRQAIKNGRIEIAAGNWVEIDVQQEVNSDYGHKYATNGGSSGRPGVKIDGKDYTRFTGLWNATSLKEYEMNVGQEGGWIGVRIESLGNGSYISHYYTGQEQSSSDVGNSNYKNTAYMNQTYGKDGTEYNISWTTNK